MFNLSLSYTPQPLPAQVLQAPLPQQQLAQQVRPFVQPEVIVISDDDEPPTPASRAASGSSTPKKSPSMLRERISFLERNIKNELCPIEVRLLRTMKLNMPSQQQRKYCSMFWPSNEAALRDLHEIAKLSPDFSIVYVHRIAWAKLETETEPAIKESNAAHIEAQKEALRSQCMSKYRDMKKEEDRAQRMDLVDRRNKSRKSREEGMALLNETFAKEDRAELKRAERKEKRKQEVLAKENARENRKRKASGDESPKKRSKPRKEQKSKEFVDENDSGDAEFEELVDDITNSLMNDFDD